MSTHRLLLAIHSPLLAGLLRNVGEGVVGLTLPLPLTTLRGLVALLQGEAREVEKEVKEAAADLGIEGQDECERIDRGSTPKEEPPSDWEDEPENNAIYKEEFVEKSLKNSKEREEDGVLGKEEVESDSEDDDPSWREDPRPMQKNSSKHRRGDNGSKEEAFSNGSQPSRKRVLCTLCSKTFTNKYYLKKHNIAVHEKNEKSAQCSHCLKQVSMMYISNHEKICKMSEEEKEAHNKKYDYKLQCSDCDKTFMNLSKLNRHKESVHSRDKSYKCQYCGIQEQSILDLKLHVKQNHEGDKYKPKYKPERTLCNVCCRSFNNKQYLEKHMLFVHENTDAKFIPCSVCAKEYSLLSIANHERKCKMSDKEREEYKEKLKAFCQDCGKTFSSDPKLKRHIKTVHNNEKLFKCMHCDRRDFSRYNLKIHVQNQHTGEDIEESISNI